MIDKPDPAKDAGRPDSPGAKRPHATLDLKATEVKPPASSASSAAAASTGKPAEQPKVSDAAAASQASAASSSSPGGAAAASKPAPPGSVPPKAPDAKPAAPKNGDGARRGGGVFSHLTAGVLGGAMAYAGAALLGPGAQPPSTSPSASELEARLVTVETALRETADLNAKIAETESRLAKLDQVEQRVATLGDAQSKLEAEARDRAATGDAASAERVRKLEERLAMIADGANGAEGAVPELAAITGKLATLEKTVDERISNLSASVPAETETRLAAALEAGEAAKSATERLERELADLASKQSAATRDADAAKSEVERLVGAFGDVRRETDRLQTAVADLRASLESNLKQVARPGDVTAALGPVTSKIAELEQNLGSVVEREDSRRQNAERIVLALELANLKRAIDRGEGHGYATELATVAKSAGGELDLSALERFKDTGVATLAELKASFRPVMNAAIDAEALPADGSVIERLMAGAKSVVRVRKVAHDPSDTSVEAVISRMEAALDAGRLADVIAEAGKLSPKAQAPMEDWLIKVTARDTVDRAIARVEDRLKASLTGAPATAPVPSAEPAPAATPDAAPPVEGAGSAAPEPN